MNYHNLYFQCIKLMNHRDLYFLRNPCGHSFRSFRKEKKKGEKNRSNVLGWV